jgi:mono/diheme cytochrome c family protein
MKWDADGKPELPPFPSSQVPEDLPVVIRKKSNPETAVSPERQNGLNLLAEPLARVVAKNTIARGGWLYTNNCHRCHLEYDKARMGRSLSQDTLYNVIVHGKTSTQMRPFSRMLGGNLKTSDIKAIIAFISFWEQSGEAPAIASELMTPPALDPAELKPIRLTAFKNITGDVGTGLSLFQHNCRICHGPGGRGLVGPSLKKTLAGSRTDLYFKSVIKNGVPLSVMRSWDINGGGVLSAKDVDDIVSVLVSWRIGVSSSSAP